MDLGARVSFIDPFVNSWAVDGSEIEKVVDLNDGLREAQVAVLLQAHSAFDRNLIASSGTCTLDTRGVLSSPNVVRF